MAAHVSEVGPCGHLDKFSYRSDLDTDRHCVACERDAALAYRAGLAAACGQPEDDFPNERHKLRHKDDYDQGYAHAKQVLDEFARRVDRAQDRANNYQRIALAASSIMLKLRQQMPDVLGIAWHSGALWQATSHARTGTTIAESLTTIAVARTRDVEAIIAEHMPPQLSMVAQQELQDLMRSAGGGTSAITNTTTAPSDRGQGQAPAG